MAATVSVSLPTLTAVCRASSRCRQGRSSGAGVDQMEEMAACRAVTTKPFGVNRDGRTGRRLVQAFLPEGPVLSWQKGEAVPDPLEVALPDRSVDGDAPEGTGLAGERVGVGKRGDGHGGLDKGVVVTEVAESDRSRAASRSGLSGLTDGRPRPSCSSSGVTYPVLVRRGTPRGVKLGGQIRRHRSSARDRPPPKTGCLGHLSVMCSATTAASTARGPPKDSSSSPRSHVAPAPKRSLLTTNAPPSSLATQPLARSLC